jgi:hypothetical protein
LSEDNVGESSFEAAQSFSVALSVGAFSAVVGPPRGITGDLDDSHGVQAAVELAVTGTGEAMAGDIARGGCDGCGSGVGGERIRGAEAVDVTHAGRDFWQR